MRQLTSMTVEPAGSEFTEVPGTDIETQPFVVTASYDDGLTVRATGHAAEGRLVCRSLELTSDGLNIDREVLRTLALATLLRRAVGITAFRIGTSDDAWADPVRFGHEAIASELDRFLRARGPHRLSDDFLRQVADTYRDALRQGESTAAAIARKWPTERGKPRPEATARRWIAAARRGSFLEPTTRGRKGG